MAQYYSKTRLMSRTVASREAIGGCNTERFIYFDTGHECATFSRHGHGSLGVCMRLQQKSVLAGLAIALASISACRQAQVSKTGPPPHHGQEKGRVFWVSVYTDPSHPSRCYVDWPAVTLWKSQGQTIKWVSDDGLAYTVDFGLGTHGSPFAQSTFSVPANGAVPSGALTQSGQYFDYGIKDANGQVCARASDPFADPGLSVNP